MLYNDQMPFTVLFAQFFGKFNKPKVQWLSRRIGGISVQALSIRFVNREGAILDC